MISVGSHDNFVDIYETNKYNKVGSCSGSSSFIVHLDWSTNSKTIQVDTGDYQVLYYEIPSCNRVVRLPASTEWATYTTVLGESVAGIWPPYSDKTDVNSLDRYSDTLHLINGF